MSPVFRHGRLRLYLLRLLDEEPRHGYEVIRMLRDQFMGVYAPSPGTIYPRLARLEEEGLVTHDEVDGRKVYRITEAGRQELRERGDELAELEQELSDSVRDIVREVKEDVRETVRSLREELTWAARNARRPDEQDGEDGPAQPGTERRCPVPLAGHAGGDQAADPVDSRGREGERPAGARGREGERRRMRGREGERPAGTARRGGMGPAGTRPGPVPRAGPGLGQWAAWADWPGRRGWAGRTSACCATWSRRSRASPGTWAGWRCNRARRPARTR